MRLLNCHGLASNWGSDTQSNLRTGLSYVPTRVLKKAFQELDSLGSRVMMRGSGSIELGRGLCIMKANPRLFISKLDGDDGFGNVEFMAYGKYQSFGSLKSFPGLAMAARTSH